MGKGKDSSMIKMIFHTDLDNTLIYSYKHDIGKEKTNVELYQGREISFVSAETKRLLEKLTTETSKGELLIVPTTTRTREQYERIHLGIGDIPYALVCNGGVLLHHGKEVDSWYRESLRLVEPSRRELEKGFRLLEQDSRRSFETRFIRELFVFTKCEQPEAVVWELREQLDNSLVDVFCNGVKIYILPKHLDKGTAVERFRDYMEKEAAAGKRTHEIPTVSAAGDCRKKFLTEPDGVKRKCEDPIVFAAGDSEFDVPMVLAADRGAVPESLGERFHLPKKIQRIKDDTLFSEGLLAFLSALVHGTRDA